MSDVLRRLLSPTSQALAWGVAFAYLAVFLIAIADVTLDGAWRPFSTFVVANWQDLVFRQRSALQFEAVTVVELAWFVWLVSPVNIAIGLALGLLTGLQIALVRIAKRCAVSCGLSPVTGILAGLPGLLAGSACCAPILFLLLGIQLTASLVTLMGLLIPVAFVLLTAGLVLTLRVANRQCKGVPA